MPIDPDLSPQVAAALDIVTERATGLVLICGPTNSEKTTTAEGLSRRIASRRPMVTVNLDLPLSSAATDLDETIHVLAGRIRHTESALPACELSSRTLVIATAGSGESTGMLGRFLDMQIPERVLVDASVAILTKRLCRRLCQQCRTAVRPSEEDLEASPLTKADLAITNGLAFEARSCSACSDGYKGTVPVFELLMTEHDWSPGRMERIRMLASMVQDAVIKVTAGLTSLAEIAWMMGPRRFSKAAPMLK